MVKRSLLLALACLLAFAPALAAVETTTITGSVVDPGGAATTGGTIRWSLSMAGTALDGATPVTVSGDTVCTLTGAGALSGCALVPNDAITPTGTYYVARFSVTTAQGVRSWTRNYSVATTPDPVALGSVTALNVPPGVTVGPFVQVQDAEPSGACTLVELPKFARDTNRWCDCDSSIWSCVSGGGGGLSGLTSGRVPYATSSTTIGDDPGGPFWDATNDGLGVGGPGASGLTSSVRKLIVRTDQNAATEALAWNATDGTASQAIVGAQSTTGAVSLVMRAPTWSNAIYRNLGMLRADSLADGLILATGKATAPVIFHTADAERGRITPEGWFEWGASGVATTNRQMVGRFDQSAASEFALWNNSSGSGAQSIVRAKGDVGSVSLIQRSSTYASPYTNVGALFADSASDGLAITTTKAGAPVLFRTQDVERMRLTDTGLGIGKTPTVALDVNGTAAATAFVGPLTGNASTATALAADPADCSAGQAAGGVNASGAAAGCLDPIVSTEIDTSAELAAILGDETGSGGGFVRAQGPTFLGSAADFSEGLTVAATKAVEWPTTGDSLTAKIRLFTDYATFNGKIDSVWYQCYNCAAGGLSRADASEHQFKQQTEYTYWDTVSTEATEVNWDYISADGLTSYRPLGYFLRVTGGTLHESNWYFNTNSGERAFTIRDGGIRVGNGSDTSDELDVYGTTGLRGDTTITGVTRVNPTIAPSGSGDSWAADINPVLSSTSTVSVPNIFAFDSQGTFTTGTNSRAAYTAIRANPKLSGTATGTNLDRMVGVWAVPQMGGSGTSTTVQEFHAFRANLYFGLGSNHAITTAAYFWADNALATSLATGASLNNFYGLRIPDMAGVGSITNYAIHIASQTGSAAGKGNIHHAGGNWNNGHLVLGDDHIWTDATNDRLRYKPDSNPTSETDGRTVVTSAASTTSGPAAWAANGVSCATACTNIGVANCSDSIPLDGTNTALGNCTGTTGHRVCECY